jgi:hypothetical protein
MASDKPKGIINLSGKDYPTWPFVLDKGHERGLKGIRTELIQIPTEENLHTAIVKATVTLEDGSEFEDYGDANPKNTSAKVATALIRMASTRAKGRAMRDAVNIGETMFEEMPDLEESRGDRYAREIPAEKFGAQRAEIAGANPPTVSILPPSSTRPKARYEPGTVEGDAAMAGNRVRGDEESPRVCNTDGCGAVLTKGQYDVSTQRFGKPLCPTHQKALPS